VTYVYEPESFVPLARVESRTGISNAPIPYVHTSFVDVWNPSLASYGSAANVEEWRSRSPDRYEQQHTEELQRRVVVGQEDMVDDSILYYQCDHLGTASELLADDGKSWWAIRYCAWGRTYSHLVCHVDQPLRFQGQYLDEETGLHYNRFRYFDKDSARFLTQDPIGLLGGGNSYQYAPNPIGWVDPMGLRKRAGCSGKFHSFHDFSIPQDKYFASDPVQFRLANKDLLNKINEDSVFKKQMFKRNPSLVEWSKNPDLSKSPPNMTWHHNDEAGLLNLVSFEDHRDNHGIYHPDGTGGRDKWGGGKPGRKGKLNQSTGCPLK
jgi:RHS repeat-associated protein